MPREVSKEDEQRVGRHLPGMGHEGRDSRGTGRSRSTDSNSLVHASPFFPLTA